MANTSVASFARTHFPLNSIRLILQFPDDFTGTVDAQLRNAGKVLTEKTVVVTDYPTVSPKAKLVTVATDQISGQAEASTLNLDIIVNDEVPLTGLYTFSYLTVKGSASPLDPIPLTMQDSLTTVPVTILGGNGGGVVSQAQIDTAVSSAFGAQLKPFTFTAATGVVGAEMPHNFGTKAIEVIAFDANGVRDMNVGIKPKAGTAAVQNSTSTLFFTDDDTSKYPSGKFVGTVYLRKLS